MKTHNLSWLCFAQYHVFRRGLASAQKGRIYMSCAFMWESVNLHIYGNE